MAGITPLFDDRDLERFFDKFLGQAEEKILEVLKYCGEQFIIKARNLKTYEDRTGNLRSSIGYIVLNNGSPEISSIYESEKGTDRVTGVRTGSRLMDELAQTYPLGWVLIVVAGMDYAVWVENIYGLDVISGSATEIKVLMREIIK